MLPGLPRWASALADEASIGLSMCVANEMVNTELLGKGVEFCDLVEELLGTEDTVPLATENLRQSLFALAEKAPGPPLNLDPEEARRLVARVRPVFVRLIDRIQAIPPQPVLLQTIESMNRLAALFYRTDISNLRQLKERRGLQAYG